MLILNTVITPLSLSQNNSIDFLELATWSLIQVIPSPSFYEDRNNGISRLQFGLKWNITPLNYSFNANKFVSPIQFFKVNPIRRYGGSIEMFVQPEWATGDFRYADIHRFSISPGIRLYAPLIEYGEYLSGSIGLKYSIRKDKANDFENVYGTEVGLYTFFGILGFSFTYNFTTVSRYNFSLNVKYY